MPSIGPAKNKHTGRIAGLGKDKKKRSSRIRSIVPKVNAKGKRAATTDDLTARGEILKYTACSTCEVGVVEAYTSTSLLLPARLRHPGADTYDKESSTVNKPIISETREHTGVDLSGHSSTNSSRKTVEGVNTEPRDGRPMGSHDVETLRITPADKHVKKTNRKRWSDHNE